MTQSDFDLIKKQIENSLAVIQATAVVHVTLEEKVSATLAEGENLRRIQLSGA